MRSQYLVRRKGGSTRRLLWVAKTSLAYPECVDCDPGPISPCYTTYFVCVCVCSFLLVIRLVSSGLMIHSRLSG